MTSNHILTDIAGNVLGDSSNDNKIYPTKFQNNIDYINTTGDTFTGNLNLNRNRIYLNNNMKPSIYENYK